MNNCPRCKLNIKDDALVCPLCHGVIKREHAKDFVNGNENPHENKIVDTKDLFPSENESGVTAEATTEATDALTDQITPTEATDQTAPTEPATLTPTIDFYPDVHPAMRKNILFLKILCFVAVVAEIGMLFINFIVSPEMKWSLITGVAMFYGCFTICISVLQNRSLRRKILVQLIVGILVMFALDYLIGYNGWAIEIGTPIAILSVQLLVLILMIVYRNRWQSYLFLQVAIVVMSLFFVVLMLLGIMKHKVLTVVAFMVTILILVALLLFGGRRAGDELKERFRI